MRTRLPVGNRFRRRSKKSPTSPVFYADKARFLPAFGKGHFPAAKGILSRLSFENSILTASKWGLKGIKMHFDAPNHARTRSNLAHNGSARVGMGSNRVNFPRPTLIAIYIKSMRFHQKVYTFVY